MSNFKYISATWILWSNVEYKCKYCDYSAVTSGAVRTHTKLKHETFRLTLHYCDVCGKEFKTKGNLKEHMPTHSEKRTFHCKICGKYLKNDSSYRRHMVCVHSVKFTCDLCGKDYSALIGLKTHQKNVHDIHIWPQTLMGIKMYSWYSFKIAYAKFVVI